MGMGMLVLSRGMDESICIGNSVTVKVVDVRGDKVRLGIEAPKSVSVHREEVTRQIGPVPDAEARRVGLELLDLGVEWLRVQRPDHLAPFQRSMWGVAIQGNSTILVTAGARLLAGLEPHARDVGRLTEALEEMRSRGTFDSMDLIDRTITALDAARKLREVVVPA